MLQAEFSILDFKATEEPTKVQLPLYIELKGKRIDTGCGSLTVCCPALLEALLLLTLCGSTPCPPSMHVHSIFGIALCGNEIVAMHAQALLGLHITVMSCKHMLWRAGHRNQDMQ